MANNKRRIQKCFHSEAARKDGKLELTFFGRNKNNTKVESVVEIDWWHYPYVIREAKKAWDAERAARMQEISRVDAAFTKEEV